MMEQIDKQLLTLDSVFPMPLLSMFQVANIYAPNFGEVEGHISLGLSVLLSIRPSLRYACPRSRNIRDKILKFGMWDEYEN